MPLRRRDANANQLNVRMPSDELKSLDAWIKTQPAPRPTRAEAIRRLVEQALAGGAQPSQKKQEISGQGARNGWTGDRSSSRRRGVAPRGRTGKAKAPAYKGAE
jgi:hypothetical protein